MTDVYPNKMTPPVEVAVVADTVSGLFSSLADAMPQMIFVTDADGSHFYYNRGWYDYTGMSESESMGFGFAKALHPDARERTIARWQLAWEAGADYSIEYRFKRFDGVYRWFVGRAAPVRDNVGNVRMWVGTCTDIDDTRRAFDELRESQDRLNIALRVAHLGTWEYNIAEQSLRVSDEIRVLFGVKGDGIFALDTFLRHIHPDDVAPMMADFEKVVRREADEYGSRYRILRPDGTMRHGYSVGRFYDDADTVSGRIIGVVQDVTESQNTLDALQTSVRALGDSQERLSLALQTARMGTWELDHATQLFDFSPRTLELFGLAESPVPYETWANLLHEDDCETVLAAAAAFVRADPPYEANDAIITLRYRVRRADGTLRHLLIKGSHFIDANGLATRSLGVAQDETEERNTLQALRESADALQESEARFRSVVTNAPIVVFALDKNGVFTFSDGAGLASLGRSPGELVGRSVFEMYQDRPEITAYMRRVLAGERVTWTAVVQGISFETQCNPIFDSNGSVDGVIVVAFDVTEKAKANEALAAREEQYRFLFDTVASGVVYQDGDARILDANAAAEDILGLTLGQMTGRDSTDPRWKAIKEDGSDFPGDEHPVPVALRTGKAVRGVTMGVFHPKEERYRWLSVSAIPMFRAGESKPHQVYAYFEDHTERREADRLLREEESRFRALADNISQLAWMTDETGYIHWYNQRWFDYTGTTFDEMRGWGWQTIHHPDYVVAVTEKFKDHVSRGETWEDTFPIRGADGTYRWFLSRAVPLRDDTGKIVRWFGTNTDVTEARDADAEIRQSEERFRSLITATAQIVWTTRANGAFTAEQTAWAEFTGQSFDEYRGAGWLDAVHPDDQSDTAQTWQEAVAAQKTVHIEHRLRRADGEYRFMLMRAVPVMEAGGGGSGMDRGSLRHHRPQGSRVCHVGIRDKASPRRRNVATFASLNASR